MKSNIKEWILYNIIVCFAVYWLSNLILWYPWSVNEHLGQILMLTVNPILWGLASYVCIRKYPDTNILKGVFLNSMIFILEAIISDIILFAGIQKAMDKLMHPTTLYGWAFVATVPFLIYLIFKKRVKKNGETLTKQNFKVPLIIGLFSFTIIATILIFNIRFY
jgi:hypothetical protein